MTLSAAYRGKDGRIQLVSVPNSITPADGRAFQVLTDEEARSLARQLKSLTKRAR